MWTLPFAERFWSKVDRNGPIPDYAPHLGPCWLWTAYKKPDGYGKFAFTRRRIRYAHIVAYELEIGLVPDGLVLDHLCRVPACVRPSHLEPVTHRVNIMRGISPCIVAYKSGMCIKGLHAMTPENRRWVGKKGVSDSRCRSCAIDRLKERRQGKDLSQIEPKVCVQCGNEFRRLNMRGKFCSLSCSVRHQRRLGLAKS